MRRALVDGRPSNSRPTRRPKADGLRSPLTSHRGEGGFAMMSVVMGMTAIVQIAKTSDDEPSAIIQHLHSTLTRTKQIIVVDTDIDIYRRDQVDWAIATRCQPDKDFHIRPGLRGTALDPSATNVAVGGDQGGTTRRTAKLGIDATRPAGQEDRFERVDVTPDARQRAKRVIEEVRARLTP